MCSRRKRVNDEPGSRDDGAFHPLAEGTRRKVGDKSGKYATDRLIPGKARLLVYPLIMRLSGGAIEPRSRGNGEEPAR